MFRPGRAKLVAKPALTGSPTIAATMGTAGAACWTARTPGPPAVRNTSTGAFSISSAASEGSRARSPSAQRVFDDDVLPFNPSKLLQALPERLQRRRARRWVPVAEVADPPHLSRLLRLDR